MSRLIGAIFFLASLPSFSVDNTTFTFAQMMSLLSEHGISTTIEESEAVMDENMCANTNSGKAYQAFDNVMGKFGTKENFLHTLIGTWANAKSNHKRVVEIITASDGIYADFDEGLSLFFDVSGHIAILYHWDHYSTFDPDYRALLKDIALVDPRSEHEFHFQGRAW